MKYTSLLQLSLVLSVFTLPVVADQIAEEKESPKSALELKPSAEGLVNLPVAVRHVNSMLVAHWLDPKHYPLGPNFVAGMVSVIRQPKTLIPPPEGVNIKLPTGINQIIAIEPQNALILRGTPEAVAELKKLVELLDQPLRLIEIQARLIQVDEETLHSDAALSWLESSSTTEKDKFKPHIKTVIAPTEIETLLQNLLTSGKVNLLGDSKETAINNTPVFIGSGESTKPISSRWLEHRRFLMAAWPDYPTPKVYYVSGFKIVSTFPAMVTINQDETMTLLTAPSYAIQKVVDSIMPPLSSRDEHVFTNTLKAGQTLAITEAEQLFSPPIANLDTTKPRKLVMLLTPRIIQPSELKNPLHDFYGLEN